MTGDESLDFQRLWAEEPSPAEQALVRSLGRKAVRIARLWQYAELSLAVLLGVAIIIALLWRPAPAPLTIGGLIVAVLAWSAWKRHRLGAVMLGSQEPAGEGYVEASIRAKEAELKRSSIGLALMVPVAFAGLLARYTWRGGESLGDFFARFFAVLDTAAGVFCIAVLAGTTVVLVVLHRRVRMELVRLRLLLEEHRAEDMRDCF